MKTVENMTEAPHACLNCKRGERPAVDCGVVRIKGTSYRQYLCLTCVTEAAELAGLVTGSQRRIAELEGVAAVAAEVAEEHDRLVRAVKETLRAGALRADSAQVRLRQARGHKRPEGL